MAVLPSAPSFSIRQVEAPFRSIRLVGRALPYRPAQWVDRAAVRTIYYPGNDVADAQIGGTNYAPSTFKGMWKDAFLSVDPVELVNFPPVVSGGGASFAAGLPVVNGRAGRAVVLRDAARLMLKDVRLVKVQWTSILRYGYLVSTNFSVDNVHDLAWELEFLWTGEARVPPKITRRRLPDPLGVARGVLAKAAELLARAQAKLEELQLFGEELLGAVVRTTGLLGDLSDTIARAIGLGTVATNVAVAARRSLAEAREAAYLARELARRPPATVRSGLNPLQTVDLANEQARLVRLFDEVFRALLSLESALDEGREPSATVVVREGQSLRALAQEQGAAGGTWTSIAAANNLKTGAPPAGTAVRVPR